MAEITEARASKSLRVLYVGNDRSHAKVLKQRLLDDCGHHVEVVLDSEQGLHSLLHHDYDMTILNYHLSSLNASQLIRILRDNGVEVPAIVLLDEPGDAGELKAGVAGVIACLVKNEDGSYIESICSAIDQSVKQQRRQRHSKMLFTKQKLAEMVFDATQEGIVVTNARGVVEAVNPAFSRITGYTEQEVVGGSLAILKSGRHDGRFFRHMWDTLNDQGSWEGEIWNRRKSGEVYPQWLMVNSVRDQQGSITEYIGVFTDITKRKADEEEIWHRANFDPLTDLPNRTLLYDRADEALRRAGRDKAVMCLIFIDLDHFKYINDHFGHAAGDTVLIEVANRIKSALRKSDTVVRFSGDEFIVLMPMIHQAEDAARVAEKVIERLAETYMLGNNKVYLSGSAGIAVYPNDGEDIETLIDHADMAMYQAKQKGRNQYCYFDNHMNDEADRRAQIEKDLIVAINENQLMMYYQPVINLAEDRITHAEALIRWQHPEKGMIPPDQFISVAEQTGLIMLLGDWVANAVAGQYAAWHSQLTSPLQIFLNVSPVQIMHANLDRQLAEVLEKFNLPEGVIGLELTENVLIDGADKVKAELNKMREMGLRFLIDDFGTGFSSMRYLHQLPVDGLKIDRAFVFGLDEDRDKAVLVKAMIDMAHNLNLKVVAEGVETEAELKMLRQFECDYVQGYLLGRPMPAGEFINRVLEQ